jgi:hypothetical protein
MAQNTYLSPDLIEEIGKHCTIDVRRHLRLRPRNLPNMDRWTLPPGLVSGSVRIGDTDKVMSVMLSTGCTTFTIRTPTKLVSHHLFMHSGTPTLMFYSDGKTSIWTRASLPMTTSSDPVA